MLRYDWHREKVRKAKILVYNVLIYTVYTLYIRSIYDGITCSDIHVLGFMFYAMYPKLEMKLVKRFIHTDKRTHP